MKTAAYVSFGLMGLFSLATFVAFGLAAWFGDTRFGWLGLLGGVAAFLMSFVGGFFASQAGLGVKK